MSEAGISPLRWSAQLSTIPSESTPKLVGDKIILPQSALEQLLSAATETTVVSESAPRGLPDGFDPFNPYTFPARDSPQVLERHQNLPHPLIFRVVNPANGNVVYAGIREFSANEGEIGISPFVRQALGVKDPNDALAAPSRLTVHAQDLPKGTSVRFRPLAAGYDADWKPLLERHLRNNFTTLTMGDILTIPSGKDEYRFLIDRVVPNGDGICVIDTDLEVDIEPLNEEQARETLKQRLEKSQKAPPAKNGSSLGGDLAIGVEITGQVHAGDYVDYALRDWNRGQGLEVKLDAANDVDLFVSVLSPRQRARPREDEHTFEDISDVPAKRIRLQPSNVELEGAEALYISVHGYVPEHSDDPPSGRPFPYAMRVIPHETSMMAHKESHSSPDQGSPNPDEVRCKNCSQFVPAQTMLLHESFCYRNNILCQKCQQVFKKSAPEWKEHWHCPHDDSHGDSLGAKRKHDALLHTSTVCKACGAVSESTMVLARHRTSECPEKIILCQFCHLLVPQQGPEDPGVTDPDVIISGLTPHELSDGASTTDCHLCGRFVRLRDMSMHLKHHDLQRLSRLTPQVCRNINCGRTLNGIGPNGDIKPPKASGNDLGLCDTCYGPLYNTAYDPEGKALKRRVERRYLTQLLTGCGKDWCRNDFCKSGRRHLGLEKPEQTVASKEALAMIKPILEGLARSDQPLHLCTDEHGQKRRVLAELVSAERGQGTKGDGYTLPWCVAAVEAGSGDVGKARTWLENWAPTRAETAG